MVATRPIPRVLAGNVVVLEPLRDDDLPELYRAIGNPDVFAGGWGGGPAGHRATEAAFVDFARGYFAWQTGNVYAVRLAESGRLVGTSTLGDFDETNEHAHIGWTAYDPEVWGTAVNPETKLLMLGEAFDHGFGRVKLQADELNDRSRAAILKLGATFEGIMRRDRLRADGTWRDTAVYSVTIDDWPAVRAGLVARLEAFGVAPARPASGSLARPATFGAAESSG
jgi:RimJ/RimL family protein N-acetyltransferase